MREERQGHPAHPGGPKDVVRVAGSGDHCQIARKQTLNELNLS